jgi:hypothetical protein
MRRDKTAQRINELDAMLWDEITSNSSKQDHYGLIPSPARVKELEGQVKSHPKAPVAGGYTTLLGRALGNIKYITAFIVIAFTFVSPFSLIPLILLSLFGRYVLNVINAESFLSAIFFLNGKTKEEEAIDGGYLIALSLSFVAHTLLQFFFLPGFAWNMATAVLWVSAPLFIIELLTLVAAKVWARRNG